MRPRIRLHQCGGGSQWPAPMLPRWRADLSREAGGSVRRLEPALNQNLSAGNFFADTHLHAARRLAGRPLPSHDHDLST